MYFYSSEVRWFFSGTTNEGDPLHAWFTQPLTSYGIDPKALLVFEDDRDKPRIDEYLILRHTKTVGTKLRGGKESSFEVKAQAGGPAPWSAVDRVNGCVDSWTKWSFKHETLTNALDPMRQDGDWIRIGKDRWLRKMSVEGGKPSFVAAADRPKIGCNFELTRVFIDNDRTNPKQAWSTICFEAFGPELDRTRVILDACAKLALADLGIPPKVELTERTSLSYPAWFATLGR